MPCARAYRRLRYRRIDLRVVHLMLDVSHELASVSSSRQCLGGEHFAVTLNAVI